MRISDWSSDVCSSDLATFRKRIELRDRRHVGIYRAAFTCLADQFRQAVISLRSDDDIQRGRAPDDFLALRLGDAPGDHHPASGVVLLKPSDFGIDLFGLLFANMTGVQTNEIDRC